MRGCDGFMFSYSFTCGMRISTWHWNRIFRLYVYWQETTVNSSLTNFFPNRAGKDLHLAWANSNMAIVSIGSNGSYLISVYLFRHRTTLMILASSIFTTTYAFTTTGSIWGMTGLEPVSLDANSVVFPTVRQSSPFLHWMEYPQSDSNARLLPKGRQC